MLFWILRKVIRHLENPQEEQELLIFMTIKLAMDIYDSDPIQQFINLSKISLEDRLFEGKY